MKDRMPYLLLACCIALNGCILRKKATAPQPEPPRVSAQATAQLDASKVLPLLHKFKPELGMKYIIDVLGEPGPNIGSAVYSYFYPLTDGTSILVQAHVNHHYRVSGESKYGPVIKIEHAGEIIYDSRK